MRAVFADCFFCRGNAGAVDQAHQLAHGHGLGDHRLAIGFLTDVTFHKGPANFFGNGFAFFHLHVGNQHLAAVGCQHAGCAFTQT